MAPHAPPPRAIAPLDRPRHQLLPPTAIGDLRLDRWQSLLLPRDLVDPGPIV